MRMEPFARDPDLYVAAFSNIGFEIDVTAPGVGVVSCFPVGRYAVMSGTSMACPVVSGIAAALLATRDDLLAAPRTADRARRIADLVRGSARDLGLPSNFQGFGLPEAVIFPILSA